MKNNEILPHNDPPMVIFQIHKNKWFLIGPLIVFALVGLVFISITTFYATAYSNVWLIIVPIFFILLGLSVAALVVIADWHSTYYILTDTTIETVSGVGTRSRTYLSLHDLSRVDCHIGIIGSIFNFGTIVIESETAEKPLYMPGVTSPNQIQDLIRHSRSHVAENTSE